MYGGGGGGGAGGGGGEDGGGESSYAASHTTVLHMKRLNQTESPIFVILCVRCFQRESFLTFTLPCVVLFLCFSVLF